MRQRKLLSTFLTTEATVVTGNITADLVHNHKIMTVSSLLLVTQSESFALKWPSHEGYKYIF